ncbi:type II toxin-antitoxin system Rv0910 family toxin [Streptomyces niger]|uniref:type II toxin-antitoxin system Rv0910 family toxin n=1 Tax=Streptomyces niger TaxID=66373 RepID=UPI00069C1476|nr:SRPBCC family protein [Streptomyces niger]
MADVTAQARIAAPAEEIWRHVTDFDTYDQWNATHTSFPQGGPATLEPGAAYSENMKLMGFPAEVSWTVRAVEPARLLDIEGKGPMGVSLRMRYALVPAGAEETSTTEAPAAETSTAGGRRTVASRTEGETEGKRAVIEATTVRIDGSFTGAAVSLMAGKLKDSAKSALEESLGRLAALVA